MCFHISGFLLVFSFDYVHLVDSGDYLETRSISNLYCDECINLCPLAPDMALGDRIGQETHGCDRKQGDIHAPQVPGIGYY